ncbi:MAG TPA: MBL fold metallo-hydrolase [Candidatus Angelobacter sp.]|nr:MBL fold metallo-hydrolase [Candidatus Angelobacter sp.]
MILKNFRASLFLVGVTFALMGAPLRGWSQLATGSMDVHWNEGAQNCAGNTLPPLQVHKYNEQTFILRESLCSTFEAPFIYLLIGSEKALLIDTGDVADAKQMPLASTVMQLLPGNGAQKLPLIVVHTHRHLDHRAGDGQFTQLPNVQVAGFDIDSVRRFYHFTDWPNGVAEVDLGDRTVDVIPTPGHNETEISFYDRNTGLFFSGDFLIPGRLLVDDTSAYIASAQRVAAFVKDRPVTYVLGGHIEKNANGELFPWESPFHPNEHVLQMTKDDLLALPAALEKFNGFYSVSGKFVMMNSIRILIAVSVVIVVILVVMVWLLVRFVRRRIRARRLRKTSAGKSA